MKQRLIGWLLAAATAVSLAACGGAEAPGAAPEPERPAQADAAGSTEDRPEDLIGTWVEPGTFGGKNNTLTVREDGSFELAYAAGGTRIGTVGILAEEHPDGSSGYWYAFYDQDGALWECFGIPEEKPVQDIYSGQDGSIHFTRVSAEAALPAAAT